MTSKIGFNLSEKVWKSDFERLVGYKGMIGVEDVKEFIKLLKEQIKSRYGTYKSTKITLESIDKLAGEKLI